MIGVVKSFEERALTSVIGNGNLRSGLIKAVGGAAISGLLGGKAGKVVGSAFAIDGVEDIINQFMGGINTAGSSANIQEDDW